MSILTMYSKRECPLCDKGLAIALRVASEFALEIEKVDIEQDDELRHRHRYRIPVFELDGAEVGWGRIEEAALRSEIRRVGGFTPRR